MTVLKTFLSYIFTIFNYYLAISKLYKRKVNIYISFYLRSCLKLACNCYFNCNHYLVKHSKLKMRDFVYFLIFFFGGFSIFFGLISCFKLEDFLFYISQFSALYCWISYFIFVDILFYICGFPVLNWKISRFILKVSCFILMDFLFYISGFPVLYW